MLAAQLAEHELQRLLEEERLEAVSDVHEGRLPPLHTCLARRIASLLNPLCISILGQFNGTMDEAMTVLDTMMSGL